MEQFKAGMDMRAALTARNLNAFRAAANWVAEHGGELSDYSGGGFYRPGEVRIFFNDEEQNNPSRNQAVVLTGMHLTSENCEDFESEVPTFDASLATLDNFIGTPAVLLEPAAKGEYARAAIVGTHPTVVD